MGTRQYVAMRGQKVEWLPRLMLEAGLIKSVKELGSPDGLIGARTEKLLLEFQSGRLMPGDQPAGVLDADGKLGFRTYWAIETLAARNLAAKEKALSQQLSAKAFTADSFELGKLKQEMADLASFRHQLKVPERFDGPSDLAGRGQRLREIGTELADLLHPVGNAPLDFVAIRNALERVDVLHGGQGARADREQVLSAYRVRTAERGVSSDFDARLEEIGSTLGGDKSVAAGELGWVRMVFAGKADQH
jgi:hypothetical protein